MSDFDPALVAARFFHFAASLTLFGTLLWSLYAPPASRRPISRGVLVGLAAIALASGAVCAALVFRRIAGEPSVDLALLRRMLLETGFGRAFLAQAALALALIAVLLSAPTGRWVHAAVGAALVGGLAFIGHATGGHGVAGAARIGGQIAHLLAAGAWLGGLPALFASLRGADAEVAARAAERFSVVGIVAVTIILATGAVNTALMLGASAAFQRTLYFEVLVVKLALVAGMIVVAAANRSFITPAIRQHPTSALGALKRNIAIEQGLGLGVLAAVSWLGTLDPFM